MFPLIVFGHGFLMPYSAYMNFVDTLVTKGYILCYPTTESGTLPSHSDFALDLKFLNIEIKTRALSDAGFFLYQKLSGTSSIMGHSMGGGAAFLATKDNWNLTTLVTFAAAETSVSAIAAASDIGIPTLLFIGENDGVTPPANHQIPMFNNLPAGCKGQITIKGGGHCYFADYNLACSTGELFTSPQPTITREAQHIAMFNALMPYLDWILKGDASQQAVFESVISQTGTYSSQFLCTTLSAESFTDSFSIYPNPVEDFLIIQPGKLLPHLVEILSSDGRQVKFQLTVSEQQDSIRIDTRQLPSGLYILKIHTDNWCFTKQFIRQ